MALDFAATYKVLVLGDSNVGKTCIVHRYCDERYYDTYISTIGKCIDWNIWITGKFTNRVWQDPVSWLYCSRSILLKFTFYLRVQPTLNSGSVANDSAILPMSFIRADRTGSWIVPQCFVDNKMKISHSALMDHKFYRSFAHLQWKLNLASSNSRGKWLERERK